MTGPDVASLVSLFMTAGLAALGVVVLYRIIEDL